MVMNPHEGARELRITCSEELFLKISEAIEKFESQRVLPSIDVLVSNLIVSKVNNSGIVNPTDVNPAVKLLNDLEILYGFKPKKKHYLGLGNIIDGITLPLIGNNSNPLILYTMVECLNKREDEDYLGIASLRSDEIPLGDSIAYFVNGLIAERFGQNIISPNNPLPEISFYKKILNDLRLREKNLYLGDKE